jgi:hypothetical protein
LYTVAGIRSGGNTDKDSFAGGAYTIGNTSDQMLYFSTIGLLERSKSPDVKRLKQRSRMSWHTKRNNLIFLVVLLKVD